MRNDRLFTTNLEALAPYLPDHLVAAFQKSTPARVLLTGSRETGDLNALVNDAPLFTPDAETAAVAEVEAYGENPGRIILPLTAWEPFQEKEYSHTRFPRAMLHRMRDDPTLHGLTIETPATGDGAYMIVIGLGLGLHIPPLIERFGFRNLLIVESDPELIYWSMHLVDWVKALSEIRRRGGEFVIGAMSEPSATAAQLVSSLRGKDFALVDRSLLYQHDDSAASNALVAAIRETAPILHGTVGFFEDEILMQKHALANSKLRTHRFLTPDAPGRDDLPPAIVVGSGPSLDAHIERIKALSDRAVIFGAGSGSGALILSGLHPHVHCALENTPEYTDVLAKHERRDAYADIPLVAPYIVEPRAADIFQSVTFYHRELLVPTRLMARPVQVLDHTTPNVSNLACRAAIALGFRSIYLFGVDLGSRVADRRHASESMYNTREDWMALSPLNLSVAANLGGQALTNKSFLAARASFEQLCRKRQDVAVLNCSDGIAIPGATPFDPSNLEPSRPVRAPKEIVRDLLDDLPLREAGQALPDRTATAYRDAVIAQFAAIRSELAKPDERTALNAPTGGPISALHDRLRPLVLGGHLDPVHSLDAAVRTTFTGTILAALQFGRFFEMRMNQDQAEPFMRHFRETLTDELTRLEDDFRALF
ncbi:MAG: DUF115 domain-containing protein [Alphaproteobacteria bacterium]|nr:DUF115 domain-containing protein [Alphaproteobacteria bacterium]